MREADLINDARQNIANRQHQQSEGEAVPMPLQDALKADVEALPLEDAPPFVLEALLLQDVASEAMGSEETRVAPHGPVAAGF